MGVTWTTQASRCSCHVSFVPLNIYVYVFGFFITFDLYILVLRVRKKCILAPCRKIVFSPTYIIRMNNLSYCFLTCLDVQVVSKVIDCSDFWFWCVTKKLACSVTNLVMFNAWNYLSVIICLLSICLLVYAGLLCYVELVNTISLEVNNSVFTYMFICLYLTAYTITGKKSKLKP